MCAEETVSKQTERAIGRHFLKDSVFYSSLICKHVGSLKMSFVL